MTIKTRDKIKNLAAAAALGLLLSLGLSPESARADHDYQDFELGNFTFDLQRGYRYSRYNCAYQPVSYHGDYRNDHQYCKRYQHPKQHQACDLAKQAARRTAAFRVAPVAMHDGLLAGLSCGIETGIEREDNRANYRSGNFLSQQARTEIQSDQYGSMETYAASPARIAGSSQASDIAIARFRAAVTPGGGQLPSRQAGALEPDFIGVADGYQKNGYAISELNALIDEVSGQQYYDIGRYYRNSFFDSGFRSWRPSTLRYRYSSRTTPYHWQVASFNNPYKIWLDIANHHHALPRGFNKISHRWEALSDHPIAVDQPVGGGHHENERGHQAEQGRHLDSPSAASLASPRAVFKEVFKHAFEHDSHHAYHRIFERGLDLGFDDGLPIGEQAGRQHAYLSGQRDAYNDAYQRNSQRVYRESFRSSFRSKFAADHADLRARSELEGFSWNLFEQSGDGILAEGEAGQFVFDLTNIGGREINFNAKAHIAGDVGSGQIAFDQATYHLNALDRGQFTTDFFLIVPEDVIPNSEWRTDISVVLTAADQSESNLVAVHRPVGFSNSNPRVDLRTSTMTVPVTLHNPRNLPNDQTSTLSFFVNGELTDQQSLLGMAPGQRGLEFVVKRDVFELIRGGFEFRLALSYQDHIVQSRANLRTGLNQKAAFADYFKYLVLEQSADLPQGLSRESQINRLVNELAQENQAAIGGIVAAVSAADNRRSRNEVKKSQDYWEVDRRQRLKHADPGLMALIFSLRPHNASNRDLSRELPDEIKRIYKLLGSKMAKQTLAADAKFTADRHRKSAFRSAICNQARIIYAFLENKRVDPGMEIRLSTKSSQKFSCD